MMQRTSRSAFAPLILAVLVVPAALACGGTVDTPAEPVDSGIPGDSTSETASEVSSETASDSPAPDGTTLSADQACTDLAASICSRIDACTNVLIAVVYGDVDTCKKRVKLGCLPGLAAPGTSSTPEKAEACAKDFPTETCIDLFAKNPAASCIPSPGKVANGMACGEDAQCDSTFCARTPGAGGCGVCAPMPKEGDACVNNQCGRLLECNTKDKCYKTRVLGETCSADTPCAASLSCFGGKCVAAAKAGEACDGTATSAPTCDTTAGLGCNPVAKVCQVLVFAKAGDTCGYVAPDFKLCTGGSFCKTTGGFSGVCVAPAADGAPCNPKDGPQCLSPAICSGGVCKLVDPAACNYASSTSRTFRARRSFANGLRSHP